MLHSFRRALTEGPARHAAGPLYAALVGAELAAARAFDVRAPMPVGGIGDVTALVKTFERPAACTRLLASLRRVLPSLRVLVVDDSQVPRDWPEARTLKLPHHVGASAGRNEGLRRVETELVAVLDDDFIAYRGTTIPEAAAFLRAHPSVGLVGGEVIDLPLWRREPSEDDRACFGGARREVGGLPVYDRVPQFFVARTRSLLDVGWDARLKTAEHTDFFRRLFDARVVTVLDRRLRVLHARTPFDREYMRVRLDYESYIRLQEEESRARLAATER